MIVISYVINNTCMNVDKSQRKLLQKWTAALHAGILFTKRQFYFSYYNSLRVLYRELTRNLRNTIVCPNCKILILERGGGARSVCPSLYWLIHQFNLVLLPFNTTCTFLLENGKGNLSIYLTLHVEITNFASKNSGKMNVVPLAFTRLTLSKLSF